MDKPQPFYLMGLDDVPIIADDKCCQCGIKLTLINFSDWYTFVKVEKQMYQAPICNECVNKNSAEGAKVGE